VKDLSRSTARLSDSNLHILNMYAIAASAAGLGALSLAQPCAAKIVYTPAHVRIGINQTIPLDLNHDGKTDFSLSNAWGTAEGTGWGHLDALPAEQSNGVDGFGTSLFQIPYAFALKAGNRVGPNAQFVFGKYIYILNAGPTQGCQGSWNNVKNRYLGLRFNIKQKTHYGWARLNVNCNLNNRKIAAVLTGYAYETIPNKPIVAGKTKGPDEISKAGQSEPAVVGTPRTEPPTLGLLAMGAPALSIWRREDPIGPAQ
jgi:hypothetical protein